MFERKNKDKKEKRYYRKSTDDNMISRNIICVTKSGNGNKEFACDN